MYASPFSLSKFSVSPSGSKIPSQGFREKREDRRGSTARKSPIGSANHQWGMKNPH